MIVYEIADLKLEEEKLLDKAFAASEIEKVISDFELIIIQKTTLAKMKGSIHYHLKQGKAAGVLEVTYWPERQRLIVEIHKNRTADWNEQMISPFSEVLADRFSGIVESQI